MTVYLMKQYLCFGKHAHREFSSFLFCFQNKNEPCARKTIEKRAIANGPLRARSVRKTEQGYIPPRAAAARARPLAGCYRFQSDVNTLNSYLLLP